MSEKSFEHEHHRLMQEALQKLEKDRGILTGSAFRKWYNSPVGSYMIVLFFFAVFCMITGIKDDETIPFIILLPLILLSIQYQADIVNKRIDKIVELMGAEEKLEEKCQAAISFLASLESKKGNA